MLYELLLLQCIQQIYAPRPRSLEVYTSDKPLALWARGLSVVNLGFGHIFVNTPGNHGLYYVYNRQNLC